MKKSLFLFLLCVVTLAGCNKPSRLEQHKAEKHLQDSVRLDEQVRSMAYYEAELERLMPVADSLIALFKYEKNDKYQDRGNYVLTAKNSIRILVRDDGREILFYQNGKRLTDEKVNALREQADPALDRADQLQIAISDIKELENRIQRTSLEIQKYRKRLQK